MADLSTGKPVTYGADPYRTTAGQPLEPALLRRVSWGAILAGAVVALVVQAMLTLLGLWIGFGAIEPTEEANPMAGIPIGAAIWWGISSIVALFVGGWVAGRLMGQPRGTDGALHGVVTWAVVTIVILYLASTAVGRVVSGVSGLVGEALQATGQAIGELAPEAAGAAEDLLEQQGITLEGIRQEAGELLRQAMGAAPAGGAAGAAGQEAAEAGAGEEAAGGAAGTPAAAGAATPGAATPADPDAAVGQLDEILGRLAEAAEGGLTAEDRQAAIAIIAERTGTSEAEAEATFAQWETRFQQARQEVQQAAEQAEAEAREAAQAASEALSNASMWLFLLLLVSLIAAASGGAVGRPSGIPVFETRRL